MDGRFSLTSCTIVGVEAIPVTVEVDISAGLPTFLIVGLPDAAVRDSQMRVRSAIKASGYEMPNARIVVNLAPADLKKTGTGFDLPIAVALLCASKQIDASWVQSSLLIGELSLDGEVRQVKGLLSCAVLARSMNISLVCAPLNESNSNMASRLKDCNIKCLEELVRLRSKSFTKFSKNSAHSSKQKQSYLDFADIAGHDMAKRALLIAAAGSHGILMNGSPGSGKSMLAKRLPSILPTMSDEEAIEVAMVHSVRGLPISSILDGIRPFRSPHHSASAAGLIGGGQGPLPGEVSLAHNGVLFLDEIPEFPTRVLQSLRQPLEDGKVTVVRASGAVSFPAKFMLVGAANPCPCGFFGDEQSKCTCSEHQIQNYQARIGGPLLDRFDITIDVWRVDPKSVLNAGTGISSNELREKVMASRDFATQRSEFSWGASEDNGESDEVKLLRSCKMSVNTRSRFEKMLRAKKEGGRGTMRTLRLARTIADLGESYEVKEEHLLEAMSFRMRQE